MMEQVYEAIVNERTAHGPPILAEVRVHITSASR